MLIAIEGADGVGKGTTCRQLQVQLRQQRDRDSVIVAFPSYSKTYFGNRVTEYLKGEYGGLDANHPYLVSLLYAFDRWQRKAQIFKLQEAGVDVILDRYVGSNIAHQGAKLLPGKNLTQADFEEHVPRVIEFARQISHLEYDQLGMPHADLTVILTLPDEVLKQQLEERKRETDMHEADFQYLRKVQLIYNDQARRAEEGGIRSAMAVYGLDEERRRTPREIAEQILERINRF